MLEERVEMLEKRVESLKNYAVDSIYSIEKQILQSDSMKDKIKCCKCGNIDMSIEYQEKGKEYLTFDPALSFSVEKRCQKNQLKYHCNKCQYTWYSGPLDEKTDIERAKGDK